MLRKIVLILFLACSTVQVTKGFELRIQNGNNARPGEVPYVVQIREQKGNLTRVCSGAILNRDFVLTAAHCIYDINQSGYNEGDINPIYIKVITGAKWTRPVSIHSVIWMRKHENNVNRGWMILHDIALLKVSPPFKFNGLVAPARLPPSGFEVPPGTEALIAGWGSRTTEKFFTHKVMPEILQKLTLPISSENYCKEKYLPVLQSIHSSQICTVIPSGLSRSACKGDSGGPLTINKNILVGIASTSPQNDVSCSKYPTVYIKVSKYIGWINENMKASNDNDIPSRLITDRCSDNRDCLIFN